MTSTTSHRRARNVSSSDRRGNTLVLVTAILVLLVIIATAYITRAQGGRLIAAAQRKAIDREDRSAVATGVIAKEITEGLFPKIVNPNDPGVQAGVAATSSTPRLSRPFWAGQKLDRYMIDPQVDVDGNPLAPYNVAPYETRPWTNWPDSTGARVPYGEGASSGVIYDAAGLLIGDDNPIGNPGFGDSRWLRSTEPQRAYDQNGNLGFDNLTGQSGFTHWSHLSWPATAENGWRVCFDIANVAPFDVLYDPYDPDGGIDPRVQGFTLSGTAADAFRAGASDYLDINFPVALQTPYEQWLPGVTPAPYNGTDDFFARRNSWFGTPSQHFFALYRSEFGSGGAMPNFIKLHDLGPQRRAFEADSDRNVVERTLADADGDGFTDSFWFLIPGVSEDGVRQVAAVSVVDNASMVDVNVATRFDRWSTAGETPADVALTSRLVQSNAQASPYASNAAVYDTADTRTGFFSDPQNTSPANLIWGLGYQYDPEYRYREGTFDGASTLRTGFDPYRFGDSTTASSSWLRQTGVLNQNQDASGFNALEAPYRSLLVAFGDGDPSRAAFDRRRYFRRRLDDGGLFVQRVNPDTGDLESPQDWNILNVPPRGFSDADELELRMFSASNYGPVISTLERTVNEPWNRNANFLRSTLARSESVENFLDYYDGNESTPWPPSQGIAIGDQLNAAQLLKDSRHRMTTYSATRNDLRPLHLRPTALYQPDFDYAFGRLRANAGDLPEQATNQIAFDVRKRKIDLRSPVDAPLSEFEALLYQGFPGPFNAVQGSGVDPTRVGPGVWPNGLDGAFGARVELDRSYRFRLELQRTIADATSALFRDDAGGTSYTQSYLGSNYESTDQNQIDYLQTQLLAASWAANVDTFRDNRPRPAISYDYATSSTNPQSVTIELDTPIFPDWAPRIDQQDDSFLPQNLRNLSFPGLEKQPFIMETFFSLVYPPSRISQDLATQLNGDEAYQQFLVSQDEDGPEAGDDTIPFGFRDSGDKWVDAESKPAIIFAIQLANPFDQPVPLQDLFIRVGDSNTIGRCLNLAKLVSPHPRALDADQPQDGSASPRNGPYYRPSELFLGPTKPEAPRTAIIFGIIPPNGMNLEGTGSGSFQDEFGVEFAEFHGKWMDFLDLEPGALFGWDPDLPLGQHQTMVFDASPQSFIRQSPVSAGTKYQPVIPPLLGLKPDRWFDDPEQSVELLRFVSNPLTYNPASPFNSGGYLYAIDRLDNNATGNKIEFVDQMKRLVEDEFSPTMEQEYSFDYPGPLDRNEWSGIRLKGDDFLASWVRAARPWGWDVNRNGAYDLSEVSPRYIFSEIPEDDWIQDEVEGEVVGSGGRDIKATTIDFNDDPDGTTGGSPWMSRSYLSPLALTPTVGVSGYPFEFTGIRGKPVHLTTATALNPASVSAGSAPVIDYDAGFPTLADGTTRTNPSVTGWPGRPASGYRWVLMNKGQAPEETVPSNRTGATTGIDSNNNGVDDGLETYQRVWLEKDQWAYPLQMLQKDADFEQIGELGNSFLWGHALRHRPGITSPDSFGGTPRLPTVFTFGEIMNSTRADDPLPVVRSDLSQFGVPNSSRIRTNRFHADAGNLTAPAGGAVENFRPFTQVVEVATIQEPWTPRLPAGISLFDGVVCDGPGSNYRPDLYALSGENPSPQLDSIERLSIEDARFGNAAGFSGKGTRGLLNVNTAPVEVLRTLPHVSRLVHNDNPGWTGTTEGDLWNAQVPTAQYAGDVLENGNPRGIATRNPQWVRVPEVIVRYREGGGIYGSGDIRAVRQEQLGMPFAADVALPFYDDRGTYNYALVADTGGVQFAPWITDNVSYPDPAIGGVVGLYPGMRRGAGIVSLGELTLMNKNGVPLNNAQSWPLRSGSIDGAARDPYAYQAIDAFGNINGGSSSVFWNPADPTPETQSRLGLGWRPPSGQGGVFSDLVRQADARLSTDRQNVRWPQIKGTGPESFASTVEIPDSVAGDAEEANLLFAGLSNLVSVRSDTFTVHLRVRSFKQNPINGVWNAADPEFVVDDSRYVFVVDRSQCDQPGDQPEIRLMSKLPS